LADRFGGVGVQQTSNCPAGAVYAVESLWEYHDVALRATVLDGSGNRMPNVVYTNQDGEANMVMGWGSAYIPPAAGYHAVWVMDSVASDCVTGLGMVDYTEHWHLNVTFRQVTH
jgi:hypothetical protein